MKQLQSGRYSLSVCMSLREDFRHMVGLGQLLLPPIKHLISQQTYVLLLFNLLAEEQNL